MILLDTDVVIEISRATAESAQFLEFLGDTPLSVPPVVAMEFCIGSRNRQELELAARLLDAFEIVPQQEADGDKAFELIQQYCLKAGLSIPDYLIAAHALNRQATLYTFNLRHFTVIPGLDARAPYSRPAQG